MFIRQKIYHPDYENLINNTYDWPQKDMRAGFAPGIPVLHRTSMDEEWVAFSSFTQKKPLHSDIFIRLSFFSIALQYECFLIKFLFYYRCILQLRAEYR